MQDLEKRIAALEKKINVQEIVVLTENEKIVWDFISKNLGLLLEIRKFDENHYTLRGTGYIAIIDKQAEGCWTAETDYEVIEALKALGLDVWEKKEEGEENGKN